jgi:hypothetical protein
VLDAILLEANKVQTYIAGMFIFTVELPIYERKKHGPSSGYLLRKQGDEI